MIKVRGSQIDLSNIKESMMKNLLFPYFMCVCMYKGWAMKLALAPRPLIPIL
jgi:hypothetical protein